MENDHFSEVKNAEIEEINLKNKLEKGLNTIAANKKINRNYLEKQIKYDRNTNFKNVEALVDNNKKPEKFYFEFEMTPEERYRKNKQEDNNKSKFFIFHYLFFIYRTK
jgi:hypothetical protein